MGRILSFFILVCFSQMMETVRIYAKSIFNQGWLSKISISLHHVILSSTTTKQTNNAYFGVNANLLPKLPKYKTKHTSNKNGLKTLGFISQRVSLWLQETNPINKQFGGRPSPMYEEPMLVFLRKQAYLYNQNFRLEYFIHHCDVKESVAIHGCCPRVG